MASGDLAKGLFTEGRGSSDDAVRDTDGRDGSTSSGTSGARSTSQTDSATTRPLAGTPPDYIPPAHGNDNPHGQGSVAVTDLAPEETEPLPYDPTGDDSGEDAVVGQSRGEQTDDGYHGHVTIAALLGNEVLGVDTEEGESAHGPLEPIQENVLDAICDGSDQQICLEAVAADSETTEDGSTNSFGAARARLGGDEGIVVGAAESNGNISDDGECQTSDGDSNVASAQIGGQAVADAAQSESHSEACNDGSESVEQDFTPVALGGEEVPIPCEPPEGVNLLPLLAVLCGAEDTSDGSHQGEAPYGVVEAISAFALDTVVKATTAASESHAAAPAGEEECPPGTTGTPPDCKPIEECPKGTTGTPPDCKPIDKEKCPPDCPPDGEKPECSDGIDNDGDGLIDEDDPGCHSDGNPDNPDSFVPSDDDESDGGPPQCSDGIDNDGDGLIDADDPGCHTDGDASNPDSYNPLDDDERDAVGGPGAGALPFTGSDLGSMLLIGLGVMGSGLALMGIGDRRRKRRMTVG